MNKQVMIRDIKQCEDYGWACDRIEWEKLLSKLEKGE